MFLYLFFFSGYCGNILEMKLIWCILKGVDGNKEMSEKILFGVIILKILWN